MFQSRCDVRLIYCGTDDLVTSGLGWFIYWDQKVELYRCKLQICEGTLWRCMTNRLYLLYIFMLFLISYRKVAGPNHVTADHASLDVSAAKFQLLSWTGGR